MKVAERFIELLPGVRVLYRQLEAGLGRARATRAECCSSEIENRKRHFQPLAWRAKDVFLRYFHIAQREPSRGGPADSHLPHPRFQDFEARHVRRNQKRRDRILARLAGDWR